MTTTPKPRRRFFDKLAAAVIRENGLTCTVAQFRERFKGRTLSNAERVRELKAAGF